MTTPASESITAGRLDPQPCSPTSPCRYRRQFGGATVCWAASRVTIATDSDCARCRVPAILDDVDCYYLQARVDPDRSWTLQWVCGASGKRLSPRGSADAPTCGRCERFRPREPSID
jgi:hypothetical protein